jgi:hypothetical protein
MVGTTVQVNRSQKVYMCLYKVFGLFYGIVSVVTSVALFVYLLRGGPLIKFVVLTAWFILLAFLYQYLFYKLLHKPLFGGLDKGACGQDGW